MVNFIKKLILEIYGLIFNNLSNQYEMGKKYQNTAYHFLPLCLYTVRKPVLWHILRSDILTKLPHYRLTFLFHNPWKHFKHSFPSTQVTFHCVKSVCIRSYSGPHFPAFRLNTERYRVSFRIQSECGKMRIRITLNAGIFYAVFLPVQLTI